MRGQEILVTHGSPFKHTGTAKLLSAQANILNNPDSSGPLDLMELLKAKNPEAFAVADAHTQMSHTICNVNLRWFPKSSVSPVVRLQTCCLHTMRRILSSVLTSIMQQCLKSLFQEIEISPKISLEHIWTIRAFALELKAQKRKETEIYSNIQSGSLLPVQLTASLTLRVLLQCWQKAAWPKLTELNRCPFTAFFSFSLESFSRFFSLSFSCMEGRLLMQRQH